MTKVGLGKWYAGSQGVEEGNGHIKCRWKAECILDYLARK